MGRYYSTYSGREGKFMFAVQPSDDPEFMGMTENTSQIHYYADESDKREIRKRVKEQYEILGVPREDRLYVFPKTKDGKEDTEKYAKWEEEKLYPKVWKNVKYDEATEEEKKAAHWASTLGNDYFAIELEKGKCLALARIRLGIDILTDIENDGVCELDAEV